MAECLRNQLSSHSSLVKTHVAWQEEQIEELQQNIEESNFCNKDIEQVSNALYIHTLQDYLSDDKYSLKIRVTR